MNKLVTICIPTFNSEETIEETLISLANQTYKNVTVKIFDNASTDHTIKIVEKHASKFNKLEIYKSEVNRGAEVNFTKCIESAEGDFAAIFHADDLYMPSMIEEQIKAFDSSQIVAVSTGAFEVNLSGKILGKRFIPKEIYKNNELDKRKLYELVALYGNFITCPSVMIRTDVLKNKIKTWDGTRYNTSADLDVWLRLTEFGKLKFLTTPLMKYRVDTVSTSFNLKKIRLHTHDIFKVFDGHDEFTKKEYTSSLEFLRFKDQSLQMLNSLKSNKPYEEVNVNWRIMLHKAFYSKWHVKYFLAALLINVIYNIRKAFKFNR